MTLRTALFTLALATFALAAPPAIGTAHACGSYADMREHQASQAVVAQLVQNGEKSREDVEVVSTTTRERAVWVSVRIHDGERRAKRRTFIASRNDEGKWEVRPTYIAWNEKLTDSGWVRV